MASPVWEETLTSNLTLLWKSFIISLSLDPFTVWNTSYLFAVIYFEKILDIIVFIWISILQTTNQIRGFYDGASPYFRILWHIFPLEFPWEECVIFCVCEITKCDTAPRLCKGSTHCPEYPDVIFSSDPVSLSYNDLEYIYYIYIWAKMSQWIPRSDRILNNTGCELCKQINKIQVMGWNFAFLKDF